MKSKLLLSLVLSAGIFSGTFAGNTYCLVNAYGEQATLTITSQTGTLCTVSGTMDYRPVGSTLWPCTGTYDKATGALHYVATNPNPDNCTFFATTVTFDYVRAGETNTGSGSFYNDCGVSGTLDASATIGACVSLKIALKKGEYGGTGSNKMMRSKLPVPAGVDFKKLMSSVSMKVSPNPAVREAKISVTADAATKVVIKVYDQNGTLVKTVANNNVSAGTHVYNWNLQTQNGTKAKTGYYTIKLNNNGDEISTRILVAE